MTFKFQPNHVILWFLNIFDFLNLYWGIVYIQKLYIFNIYILMCLDTCIHPWYHHHRQGINISRIYKNFLVFSLVWFDFCFIVKTLNMRTALLTFLIVVQLQLSPFSPITLPCLTHAYLPHSIPTPLSVSIGPLYIFLERRGRVIYDFFKNQEAL